METGIAGNSVAPFEHASAEDAEQPRQPPTGSRSRSSSGSWLSSRSSLDAITKYFVDPRRSVHKYFVFFLACCFIPGPYFHDVLLGAYKQQICAKDGLNINSTTFSWLFGLPSAMGALSGPMASVIAKWGDARSSFISGGLTFVSAVGVVISLQHASFSAMLVFRLFFWLGLYLLLAVQMVVVYKLFTGPELTVAMGFIIFACRFGGMSGFMTAGFLLKVCNGNVASAMWFSVALVGAAAFSAMLFACLRGGTATARAIIPLLEAQRRPGGGAAAGEGGEGCEGGLRADMRGFTTSTWILIAQIGLLYAAVFPFEAIETDFLETDWGMSVGYVGWYTSLGTVFGLFAWAWGLCITTTRRLLQCSSVAWACMMLGFSLFVWRSPDRKLLAMTGICMFGVSYSYLSTSAWILLPSTFGNGRDCSTGAVSLTYVAMSLGMLFSNFAAGILHDAIGYRAVCFWFVLLSALGLVSSVILQRGFPETAGADHAAGSPSRGGSAGSGVFEEVEVAIHPSFLAATAAAAAAATLEAELAGGPPPAAGPSQPAAGGVAEAEGGRPAGVAAAPTVAVTAVATDAADAAAGGGVATDEFYFAGGCSGRGRTNSGGAGSACDRPGSGSN